MREALYEDMPTMLVKILGVHAIKVQRKRSTTTLSGRPKSRHHRKKSTMLHGGSEHLSSGSSVMSRGASVGSISSAGTLGGGNTLTSGLSVMSNASEVAVSDTASGSTMYVIVQENLFHSGQATSFLKPPTTIFDLKGVLRYRQKSVSRGGGGNGGGGTRSDSSGSGGSTRPISGARESSSGAGSEIYGSNNGGGDGGMEYQPLPSTTPSNTPSTTPSKQEEHGAETSNSSNSSNSSNTDNTDNSNNTSSDSNVLVDGEFLQYTSGLPVPLYHRDRALLDCAIQNDTLFLSTMNSVFILARLGHKIFAVSQRICSLMPRQIGLPKARLSFAPMMIADCGLKVTPSRQHFTAMVILATASEMRFVLMSSWANRTDSKASTTSML